MSLNRKILYFSLFIACICCIQSAAASGVIVTDYKTQPSVLVPGETGMVSVTLTNTGMASSSLSAVNQSIQAPGSGPDTAIIDSVFLDGKKNINVISGNTQFEGSLGPGQSMTTSFYIRAPQQSGIFFPELLIRIRSHESVRFPIPVNVNTAVTSPRQPALLLNYAIEERIKPGEDASARIIVTNKGRSTADDITIRMADQDPMVAARNRTSTHIENLPPGVSTEFILTITVDSDAHSGIHEIPLDIRYETTDGTSEVLTDTLTLDIRGEAKMNIASLATDPVRIFEKEPFDLLIRLENSGTADARSVRSAVSLPMAGTKEAFVGTIEPDSDAPCVFVLTAGEPGDYPYTLTVTYEDDWGEHVISDELTLSVTGKEDGMMMLLTLIILGILLIAGWRLYSRHGAR